MHPIMQSPDGLVIILSAITSHLRVAKVNSSLCYKKMYRYICTHTLLQLCYFVNMGTILPMFTFIIMLSFYLLGFQFVVSKIQALEMMKRISHHVTDECILERIVPFLVSVFVDTHVRCTCNSLPSCTGTGYTYYVSTNVYILHISVSSRFTIIYSHVWCPQDWVCEHHGHYTASIHTQEI